MLEKRRSEKIKPSAELEKIITEILVANKRSVEPFVKIFNYSGENIAVSQLGALAGVFEITDQSEESAYIVNFLASVAKKEYFINPRRASVESFEAALHKINLALSMLVKHGNTTWLGKLNGAIASLEKNNIHFSVTGKAKIFLLRNNHFSDISLDLASEESSLHPIKTFVEVGSGRLLPGDKIIIASPEPLELFSLDDLKKNAVRMNNERFAQFLRTALVNELDMAGTIVIDIYESQPVIIKKPEIKNEETLNNVFSQQAFVPQIKIEAANLENQKDKETKTAPKEYIDTKTGHIYVQGDEPTKPSSHPSLERARLLAEEARRRVGGFFYNQRKILLKEKKQGFIFFDAVTKRSFIVIRKTSRFLRKQMKNTPSLIQIKTPSIRFPKYPQEKYGEKFNFIKNLFSRKRLSFEMLNFFRRSWFFWKDLSVKQQKIIFAGGILIIIAATGAFFLVRQTQNVSPDAAQEKPQEEPGISTSFPLDTEKNARLLQEPITLATAENNVLSSVVLNDETYLITAKEIINVSEEKHYALPQDSGIALLATPMNDLSLIFIYTDTRKLFAWSTINHSFVQNTISLPEKTIVRDIGAYLTYLYVLDDANDQIYRFPRAEGGFGEPIFWLKDSVAFEENARMAVSENIFLTAGNNSVKMFFRGRYVKNLESPNTPLAVASLFARPNLANIYALDAENKRVIVWNQEGAIIAQYFSEKLSGAQTINVNEKTNEILVTTDNSLLAFKMEQ
jgi:hypothetical protein